MSRVIFQDYYFYHPQVKNPKWSQQAKAKAQFIKAFKLEMQSTRFTYCRVVPFLARLLFFKLMSFVKIKMTIKRRDRDSEAKRFARISDLMDIISEEIEKPDHKYLSSFFRYVKKFLISSCDMKDIFDRDGYCI